MRPNTRESRRSRLLRANARRLRRRARLVAAGSRRRPEPQLDATPNSADQAQKSADVEIESVLELAYRVRCEELLRALDRVERDLYGLCEECGSEISLERLRIKPEATRCVHCQARHDRRLEAR